MRNNRQHRCESTNQVLERRQQLSALLFMAVMMSIGPDTDSDVLDRARMAEIANEVLDTAARYGFARSIELRMSIAAGHDPQKIAAIVKDAVAGIPNHAVFEALARLKPRSVEAAESDVYADQKYNNM